MNLFHSPLMPGPFDDSATARQARMGLLDDNGQPAEDAVGVLANVYAGLLFDDLSESSPDLEYVRQVSDRLTQLWNAGDIRNALLFLCVQYDGMLRTLPEPIWWIVGSQTLLTLFVGNFVEWFGRLVADMEERALNEEPSACTSKGGEVS